MEIIKKLMCLLFAVFLLAACQAYKKVPYLQDSNQIAQTGQEGELRGIKITPKDLLTIAVSCSNPELAVPFNLSLPNISSGKKEAGKGQSQQYLVDNQGNINFPILGEINVGGLTKLEVENLIVEKLKTYLKEDPIVTVRITNYRISVLGEVNRPGSFAISCEKVNLLEAIAMAGDLTIYGMRDNVKLIRTNGDNGREIITLDLNKAETVLSPYYHLQQNDIIYVTPNKVKARNSDIGTDTSLWLSATSILVSLTTLLFNIFK